MNADLSLSLFPTWLPALDTKLFIRFKNRRKKAGIGFALDYKLLSLPEIQFCKPDSFPLQRQIHYSLLDNSKNFGFSAVFFI